MTGNFNKISEDDVIKENMNNLKYDIRKYTPMKVGCGKFFHLMVSRYKLLKTKMVLW